MTAFHEAVFLIQETDIGILLLGADGRIPLEKLTPDVPPDEISRLTWTGI